jgi:hypothetical protein
MNILIISDIDECSHGNHTCHANATCTNTAGSYDCQCRSKHVGDGRSCTGIHIDLSTSRSRIASGEAARSTCFACRNLDLIKNSDAKIIAVNYYACKFHKSCPFLEELENLIYRRNLICKI